MADEISKIMKKYFCGGNKKPKLMRDLKNFFTMNKFPPGLNTIFMSDCSYRSESYKDVDWNPNRT